MFERFLERLSISEYSEKFVVKGGMLIAAIVGLDTRATMDLDTTLRNLPLTEEQISSSEDLKSMWSKYQKKFAYAKEIDYERIMDVLKFIVGINSED